ncbi:hypothetical protein Trihar35433_2274 [Trichoderma harzianum]|nr:hypothetical protein Trihar35433_2274 [Trichoderma harzianum]
MKLTAQEEMFFKEIVATLIATYQPLAISELRSLITIPDGVNLKQTILSQFTFFLEVRENIVYFSHQLSKEFLLKRYEDIDQVPRERHAHIALRCLEMLVRNNHEANVSDDISAYCATSHWIKHLLRSQFASNETHTRSISLDVALMDFLNLGFTRWLESMNKALHPLSRTSRDLLQLRDYLLKHTDETNTLHDLIVNILDAVRFHCFHDNVGSHNPAFSRSNDYTVRPKNSLLFYPYNGFKRQLMKKEFPHLLNVPAAEHNFNDIALDIHFAERPCCWAYSPDGRYLVIAVLSIFFRHASVNLSIWDAYNGAEIGILETDPLLEADNIYDKFIHSIAFSASGELAILTNLGILVWDFPTRTCIKKMLIHTAEKDEVRRNPTDLTFSPDGKELAAVTCHRIFIWTLPSFEEHRYLLGENQNRIRAIKLLGDGKIAIASNEGIEISEWKTESVVHILDEDPTKCLAFSPKRQWLAAGLPRVIKIWDIASGELLYTVGSHPYPTECLSFSFDGRRLVSASTSRPSTSEQQYCDRTIRIWDLEGELLAPIILLTPTEYQTPKAPEYIESVMFSPKDFSLAALMGKDKGRDRGEGTIRIWDTYALQHQVKNHLTQSEKHANDISCLKFSHSGKFFATYDTGGEIRIWDAKTGKLRSSFQSGSGQLFFISPEDHIVTYSDNGVVAIWDTETDAETWSLRLEIREHTQRLLCAAFSPDGKRMATASNDGYMGIWNLPSKPSNPPNPPNPPNPSKPSKHYVIELDENTKEPSSMAFSPDGTRLALTSLAIEIWNHPEYIFTELGPYFIGSAFNLKVHNDSKTPVIFHHSLESPPAQHLESDSYTLRLDGSSISWKGKLWVQFPERYRPFKKVSRFMASIYGKKIAMGYKSGHVTLLNFEGDDTKS